MPTVTISKKRFESNNAVDPGSPSSTFQVSSGSMNVFSTSEFISIPDTGNPGDYLTFRFLFWNLLGNIHTTQSVTINNIGSQDFEATAWYLLIGEGSGRPNLRSSSFSITQNQFLSNTPIESVDPIAAWASPNSKIVYTDNDVTASNTVIVNAKNFYGAEKFNAWIDLFGNCQISGDEMTILQNNSVFALVSFKEVEKEMPWFEDIFVAIEQNWLQFHTLPDPSPIDFTRSIIKYLSEREPQFIGDDLYKLTENISDMNKHELNEVKGRIDLQLRRMNTSIKMINDKLKSMK